MTLSSPVSNTIISALLSPFGTAVSAGALLDIALEAEAADSDPVTQPDFDDLSSLFTSAGANPTPGDTVTQAVGTETFRGKSFENWRAGEPELLSNPGPTFSSTSGWSAARGNGTLSISSGRIRNTASGAPDVVISQALTGLTIGQIVHIEWELAGTTADALQWRVATNDLLSTNVTSSDETSGSLIFIATATTHYVGVFGGSSAGGEYIELISASVATLDSLWTGTATSRQESTLHYLETNGSTDKMEWDLPARRNLLTYTEDLANSGQWATQNNVSSVTTVVDSTSPTGFATEITENSVDGIHRIASEVQQFTDQRTESVYAKAGAVERRFILNCDSIMDARALFDLSSGTIIETESGTATIESVGGGWYRCTVTGTGTNVSNRVYLELTEDDDTAAATILYQGDSTGSVLLTGVQLEAGSTASAYQRIGADYMDDMTVVMAIRTSDTQGMLLNGSATDRWLLPFQDGSSSTDLFLLAGSPSLRLDGSAWSPSTRDDTHTAIADGDWHVVAVQGADLSDWTKAVLAYYDTSNAWNTNADYAFLSIFPTNANTLALAEELAAQKIRKADPSYALA